MKNKQIIPFFLLILVALTQQSQSDNQNAELVEKKTKLMACINISKSRLTRDENYLDELIDFMIIRTGGDKKDKTDKIISIMLLTCYKKITDKVAESISLKSSEEIDPMTQENKNLVELEKWRDLYESDNKVGLSQALDEISNTMKEIKEDNIDTSDIRDKIDEENFNKMNAKSYGIFGLNFKEMNAGIKNIIGFSFLAIIFVLALYALKSLEKQNSRKKNKKNN